MEEEGKGAVRVCVVCVWCEGTCVWWISGHSECLRAPLFFVHQVDGGGSVYDDVISAQEAEAPPATGVAGTGAEAGAGAGAGAGGPAAAPDSGPGRSSASRPGTRAGTGKPGMKIGGVNVSVRVEARPTTGSGSSGGGEPAGAGSAAASTSRCTDHDCPAPLLCDSHLKATITSRRKWEYPQAPDDATQISNRQVSVLMEGELGDTGVPPTLHRRLRRSLYRTYYALDLRCRADAPVGEIHETAKLLDAFFQLPYVSRRFMFLAEAHRGNPWCSMYGCMDVGEELSMLRELCQCCCFPQG